MRVTAFFDGRGVQVVVSSRFREPATTGTTVAATGCAVPRIMLAC